MNLLEIKDLSLVEKTSATRKLTLGKETKAYPVYKVRLDQLFYNDRNDRIATWITQYKNDSSNTDFAKLSREEYNRIIERFIIQSNPQAITKTKNNIALVNQREAGVVLADGRIIDGNRRFTCLRLLHGENPEINYFETVILDDTAGINEKQIKMLELSIQHGEEQRVGYDLIDMAVGAYHDIVETRLLTIDEYVSSTGEALSEVKRRLETAELIREYLEFMNVPKQYHIAREQQVYSVFNEFVPILRKLEGSDKEELKKSVFSNVMLGSFDDNRKYIRNVKSVVETGFFSSYIKQQNKIVNQIEEAKKESKIKNIEDLNAFVKKNEDKAEDLQISLERSLLQSKKEQTKSKPSQIVNKSISMLMDVDTKIIDKLSDSEKDKLKSQLSKLTDAVSLIQEEIEDENETMTVEEESGRPRIGDRRIGEPIVYCTNEGKSITNLNFPLSFKKFAPDGNHDSEYECMVGFLDENYEELCPLQTTNIRGNEATRVNFSLNSRASSLKSCYLIIKSVKDEYNQVQQMVNFKINISFNVDFDF